MRVLFAMDILEMLDEDPQMLNNIIFSDEAHFSLHGHTNTWNSRYWNLDNPNFFVEMPLHSPVSRAGLAYGRTASSVPFSSRMKKARR